MDESKIEIVIAVTQEDYRRVLAWQSKARIKVSVAFLALLTILFAAGILFLAISGRTLSPVVLMPLLVPILILSFNIWLIFRNIRVQASDLVATTEPTTFVFSADGFRTEASSSSSQTHWAKLAKIHETELDFIFFPQKNIFFPFPKRFFESTQQIAQLRQLIANGIDEGKSFLVK